MAGCCSETRGRFVPVQVADPLYTIDRPATEGYRFEPKDRSGRPRSSWNQHYPGSSTNPLQISGGNHAGYCDLVSDQILFPSPGDRFRSDRFIFGTGRFWIHDDRTFRFRRSCPSGVGATRNCCQCSRLQTQLSPNIWRHIETFVRSEVGQWALVARQTRLELSVHATLGHT